MLWGRHLLRLLPAVAPELSTAGHLHQTRGLVAPAAAAVNKTVLIKELRERSGAPISDVKSCLESSAWDVSAAYDALRRKGLAAAAKKASRHAAEGLVGVAQDGHSAVSIVEINSETDFVARNDKFASLVARASAAALQLPSSCLGADHQAQFERLAALPLPPAAPGSSGGGSSLQQACSELAGVIRENIQLRRAFVLQSPGVVGSYLHQPLGPGVGRIASAVALEGPQGAVPEAARPAVQQLARDLAMHVAGMRSHYLSRDAAPADVVQRERALLQEQAAASGKPAAVIDKMVEGRLAKWAEEVCLLQQRYLLDDSKKVAAVVAEAGRQLGLALQVKGFVRVQVGEGLESTDAGNDFAAEVASMAGGRS